MTEYLVLSLSAGEPGHWAEAGRGKARSAEAAIREHAADLRESAVLVAVPARSWRPVTVTVESVVKVSLDREKA